jgi:hypothetical protein
MSRDWQKCHVTRKARGRTILRRTQQRRRKGKPNLSRRLSPSREGLSLVSSYKDLGVIISSDLSWSNHVNYVVNKANKVLGIIKRSVGNSNKHIFSTLYKSLVRPILEYASPVWSPYLVKDIHALENVQRRASRFALGQKRQEMPYEERCAILNWSSLEKRRNYASLIECYKIIFGLNGLKRDDFFEFSRCK